jgi:hypothetical protein
MPAMYAKPEWLGWLLFAAFACGVGGGFCLFKQAGLDSGIRRGLLRLVTCVLFAATFFCGGYEDHFVNAHSPRVTLTGAITAIQLSRGGRGGPFAQFLIDAPGWEYSPFTAPIGYRAYKEQALRVGDSVTLHVRVWGVRVESMEETAGSHAGWHKVFDHNAGLEWAGMFLAVPILIAGVILLVEDRGEDSEDRDGEDGGGTVPSGVQSLGLDTSNER